MNRLLLSTLAFLALAAPLMDASAKKPSPIKCDRYLSNIAQSRGIEDFARYFEKNLKPKDRVQHLVALGYDPAVATQIVGKRKEIYDDILTNFAERLELAERRLQKWKIGRPELYPQQREAAYNTIFDEIAPIEAYRGIAIEPKDYSPKSRAGPHLAEGEKYVSKDLEEAYTYAVLSPTSGSPMTGGSSPEYQKEYAQMRKQGIKHFGIVLKMHLPSHMVQAKRYIPLDIALFPDDSIFLAEVGVIKLVPNTDAILQRETIEWMSYADFKTRFMKP